MKISKLLQETLNLNDYVMFFCKCQNCYVLSALQPVVSGKVETNKQTKKPQPPPKKTTVFWRQSEKNVFVCLQHSQTRQSIHAVP